MGARMERRGISIDRQVLSRLSGEFAQTAARVEAELQEIAGEPINVGSPKQIGDILFGKMGITGGTKTKTGAWSTSAQILDELAEQGHEFPKKILEWRQVSKLKSTYTDALPTYVHPQTHRVHTTYALAATTTGRLSSNEPNLQNIPVRTEDGRKIRRAQPYFIRQSRKGADQLAHDPPEAIGFMGVILLQTQRILAGQRTQNQHLGVPLGHGWKAAFRRLGPRVLVHLNLLIKRARCSAFSAPAQDQENRPGG